MKNSKIAIIILLFTASLASCKKDKDVTPSGYEPVIVNNDHTMPGKWIGKYGFDNESPNVYYRFDLHTDGTLTEWNSLNDSIGFGTWALSGIHFTATSHFNPPFTSIFKLSAILDTVSMKVTGTWGYATSTTDGGKFYFIKQ